MNPQTFVYISNLQSLGGEPSNHIWILQLARHKTVREFDFPDQCVPHPHFGQERWKRSFTTAEVLRYVYWGATNMPPQRRRASPFPEEEKRNKRLPFLCNVSISVCWSLEACFAVNMSCISPSRYTRTAHRDASQQMETKTAADTDTGHGHRHAQEQTKRNTEKTRPNQGCEWLICRGVK